MSVPAALLSLASTIPSSCKTRSYRAANKSLSGTDTALRTLLSGRGGRTGSLAIAAALWSRLQSLSNALFFLVELARFVLLSFSLRSHLQWWFWAVEKAGKWTSLCFSLRLAGARVRVGSAPLPPAFYLLPSPTLSLSAVRRFSSMYSSMYFGICAMTSSTAS